MERYGVDGVGTGLIFERFLKPLYEDLCSVLPMVAGYLVEHVFYGRSVTGRLKTGHLEAPLRQPVNMM